MKTAERVERSENEESQVEKCMNVNSMSRQSFEQRI